MKPRRPPRRRARSYSSGARDRRRAAAGRGCGAPRAAATTRRGRARACSSAHLVLPGQRHEVHVLQVPGVVVLADARGTGLRRAPRSSSQATNSSRRRPRGARAPPAARRSRRCRPDRSSTRERRRSAGGWCAMPATHRSRALPVRLSRACCQQRRDHRELARRAAPRRSPTAGSRRSTARRSAWLVGPSCAGVSLW